MTYDDWKTRSDRDEMPQPEPGFCPDCGHVISEPPYCDCPCCHEEPE